MPGTLQITEFTDPGCPWAFSAEPSRLRLRWLYGDQLDWTRRMVVLSEAPSDYEAKGMTPEKLSAGFKKIRHDYGMPIAAHERPRMHATAPACRAVVAARLHAPESERALLRRLRILCMAGSLLDDDATIEHAACDIGIDPDELRDWMAGEDVEAALRSDMAAARDPSDAALVLDWKLADSEVGRRYTCPSYQFVNSAGECFDIPGFRPVEAYEVAIANLAPELERRHDASSVEEALEWAGEPLATVEVACVTQLDVEEAREQLSRTASFTPIGNDGYWTL
jgi:predicted DsbA family dithiol-disulfide isomerase